MTSGDTMNTSIQDTHPPRAAGSGPSTRRVVFGLSAVLIAALALAAAAVIAFVAMFTLGEPEVTGNGQQPPVVMGVGPGISVQDALASTLDQPLLINGFLYVTADGIVYFTDALAESYPPSIDIARSLKVEGIDAVGLAGLAGAGGISWSETSTQLVGHVDGNTLTVSDTIQP